MHLLKEVMTDAERLQQYIKGVWATEQYHACETMLIKLDEFIAENPDWNNYEFSDGIVVGWLSAVEAVCPDFDVETYRYFVLPKAPAPQV